MSDHDEGGALFAVEFDEEVEDDAAVGGVEVAGRFVGEEDGGLDHEGASEGDALLFAAGELDGVVGGAVEEADLAEKLLCTGAAVAGFAGEFMREEDVFFGGEGGDELVALKDEADFGAADAGHVVLFQVGDIGAVEEDAASGWSVETGEEAEQCALAAAGCTHNCDKFAMRDLEGDPL